MRAGQCGRGGVTEARGGLDSCRLLERLPGVAGTMAWESGKHDQDTSCDWESFVCAAREVGASDGSLGPCAQVMHAVWCVSENALAGGALVGGHQRAAYVAGARSGLLGTGVQVAAARKGGSFQALAEQGKAAGPLRSLRVEEQPAVALRSPNAGVCQQLTAWMHTQQTEGAQQREGACTCDKLVAVLRLSPELEYPFCPCSRHRPVRCDHHLRYWTPPVPCTLTLSPSLSAAPHMLAKPSSGLRSSPWVFGLDVERQQGADKSLLLHQTLFGLTYKTCSAVCTSVRDPGCKIASRGTRLRTAARCGGLLHCSAAAKPLTGTEENSARMAGSR